MFDRLYVILFSAKDQDDTMLEEEVAKVSCQSLFIFNDYAIGMFSSDSVIEALL